MSKHKFRKYVREHKMKADRQSGELATRHAERRKKTRKKVKGVRTLRKIKQRMREMEYDSTLWWEYREEQSN